MSRRRPRHTTVPATPPPHAAPKPPAPHPKRPDVKPRQIARIIDEGERSLLDVLDNLLSNGVVLNAELILSLANVDLVYLRLSALLCAADRILPRTR